MKSAKALESFRLRGVKNSVVEKYSDQAHFIYELLQNADDARATSARFELHTDKLVFVHNGKRRFSVSNPETEALDLEKGTLGDINAITAVGGSNKTDEATIGKFGVGFKAVFQYTATPHIYDPNVFFKIERFIVPIRLETDYPGRLSEETLFTFPFDHDKRSAEDAYADISEKLGSLDYPLLFLSNLKEISFEISGILGSYGKTIKEQYDFDGITAELVSLTQNVGENRNESCDNLLWLFSRKDVKGHLYSVGFFIDEDGHLIPQTHSAFCFFPTKESTGLNFLIHAPFLLTDSREGIQAGVQHNTDMISLLSELAADSLTCLKEIGLKKKVSLIDDNIFDIVPYDESGFTDISSKKVISFMPFFNSMKEAFQNKEIIPSTDGYVVTENAYWAYVPQIAELLSNEQLALLAKNNTAKWVFTSFGRQDTQRKNKALTNYIDSITTVWLDESDILKGWSYDNGDSYEGITGSFIESQSVDWLHRFYKWIAETKGRTELIPCKPIFLKQDGKSVAAFDAKGQAVLFLPTDGGSGYDTINEELLKNDDTLAFIKQLGISEPSLRDEIYNKIIKQYEDDGPIDSRPHFKKFFRYYQSCCQSEVKSFLDIIKEYDFVLYISADDNVQYRGRASDLYFPFEHLKKWFSLKPDTNFVSYEEYLELVGEDKKDDLEAFLSDLGVKNVPRVVSRQLNYQEAMQIQDSWPRSSHKPTWIEKGIDGCEELIESIVEEQNTDLSVFVWSQLLRFVKIGYLKDGYYSSQDNILYGRYEYFYYSPHTQMFESRDARRLRTQPWLLNSDGQFVSASELTVETLNLLYDVSGEDASELFCILGIEEFTEEIDVDIDISSLGEQLGLSEDEQREALLAFASRKKDSTNTEGSEADFDEYEDKELLGVEGDTDQIEDDNPISSSIKRVAKEISQRASSVRKDCSAKKMITSMTLPKMRTITRDRQ